LFGRPPHSHTEQSEEAKGGASEAADVETERFG